VTELRSRCVECEQQLLASKELAQATAGQIESLKQQLQEAQGRIRDSNDVIAKNKDVRRHLCDVEVTHSLFGYYIPSDHKLSQRRDQHLGDGSARHVPHHKHDDASLHSNAQQCEQQPEP